MASSFLRQRHPATLVITGYLLVIALGTGLLSLPMMTEGEPLPLIDVLFTATSATCVTGLVVVPTGATFSFAGELVTLLLLQLGGLGIMTVSVLLYRLVGRAISFRAHQTLQESMSISAPVNARRLLITILSYTAVLEAAGTLLLFLRWRQDFPAGQAFWLSVYHAVSGFCNAGFTLFPDSLRGYEGDLLVNLTMMSLIVLGGIGFPVVHEIYSRLGSRRRDQTRFTLSVQTRIILVTTTILIVGGAALLFGMENSTSLEIRPAGEKLLIPLFQSVTARTAGFETIETSALTDGAILTIMILMFIGASPGSAGGGIKTTTFALIVIAAWNRIRGRELVTVFRRTIPMDTVHRAATITLMAIVIVVIALFAILVRPTLLDMGGDYLPLRFIDYLFESVSAFCNVGLSLGVTPSLDAWGEGILIVLMLLGRVGILTFAYVIIGGQPARQLPRAKEQVMVG